MLFFCEKSYFVQKNRTWCRKGKILEVGCICSRYQIIGGEIDIRALFC